MARVLVTGVRGKTGVPLARLLAAHEDVEVFGGSSDPQRVGVEGVRPTAFSWDDRSGWAAAVDDVDGVYVVRPDRPDAPELIEALLRVVPTHSRVVLLSEQDADYSGPDGWAARTERAVRESGRHWTILRPSWFMQVLVDPRFYRDQVSDGELAFSAGGQGLAWIDARDIAAVAERALLEDGHAGTVLELTGPEALTIPRTVELLSAALGHVVNHADLTVEEAVEGMTGFDRELTALTFERVHAGSFAGVTDTVRRVTGRPPQSLGSFLADVGAGAFRPGAAAPG